METQRKQILSQAVQYFSQPGFKRLIEGMVEKYRSLGHWGGTVSLTGLKEEEREALRGFFGKDFSYQKSASLSLESFTKALDQTRFRDLSPLELIEAMYGEPLLSKKEEYLLKEEARKAFFQNLLDLYPDEYCQEWLKAILEKKPGTRAVHLAYEQNPGTLKNQMLHILKALQVLQKRLANQEGQIGQLSIERLPVFARRITRNPHSFDPDSETGRLFLQALRFLKEHVLYLKEREPGLFFKEELSKTEGLTQLYYSFGLLRDDLWNFVTCTGIRALSQRRKAWGSEVIINEEANERAIKHSDELDKVGYLEQAYREGVILNLPLKEIVKLERVFPGNPEMERIYVVENSGVFSALLDQFEDYCRERGLETLPNPPLICTHGQFKLSSLILLDKVAANATPIYYSGDFDPEGLLMLEKLKQRYADKLVPWHYDIEDYQACLSKQALNLTRIKKLEKIHSPELMPLKDAIQQTHCPGYQEGILEALWEDIKQKYFFSIHCQE